MSRFAGTGLSSSRDRYFVALLFIVVLSDGVARAQERFELEVPGQPELHSKAIIDAGTLTVTGPEGEVIVYRRDPAHDDIGYFAWYWSQGRQFIRFPESGGGAMFKSLDGFRWERSLMQVRPVGPVGGPGLGIHQPMHLDVLVRPADTVVGRIDRDGALEYWHGHADEWHPLGRFPHPEFVPGAPLRLTERIGTELPTVFTISRSGQLLEIVNGNNVNPLSPAAPVHYIPGSHIAIADDVADRYLLAVRRPGQFFQLRQDGLTSHADFGDVPVGSPIGIADDSTDSFFFTDRFGKLHGRITGSWVPVLPSLAALPADFQPYGIISATLSPPIGGAIPTIHLATVDKTGRLRIVFDDGLGTWLVDTVDDFRLTPGQPLGIAVSANILHIAFCTPAGQLVELRRSSAGTWALREIADGFLPNAPLQFRTIAARLHLFAVDYQGDLAIGQHDGAEWYFLMGSRGADLAARLVNRRVIPHEAGHPVNLNWSNTFRDPLYVEIHDLFNPGDPIAMSIPAGDSVAQAIQPDGGITIEDTYEIPVPGSPPRIDVRTYEQHARPRHKVIVWKDMVVSTFRDRTKQKRLPDSERRDLVSLGLFILPVDGSIHDGGIVSVYEEAQRANNPGAPEFRRE